MSFLLTGVVSGGLGCSVYPYRIDSVNYANVSYFVSWIYDNTADAAYCMNPWHSETSVSYTHLDVYKRQPGGQTFLMFFTQSAFLEMWIEAAFSERWRPYTKVSGGFLSLIHI